MLTYGFELEVASHPLQVLRYLDDEGWVGDGSDMHNYHCSCETCQVWPDDDGPAYLFHAQYDSSCAGEFITRVLDNWNDLDVSSGAIARAIRNTPATINSSCGLHVHVSATGRTVVDGRHRNQTIYPDLTPVAYLFVERYIMELVAPGGSRAKRDMNMTLLQSIRNMNGGSQVDAENATMSQTTLNEWLVAAIHEDRHVDLNRSNKGTWEFRVFNATTHSWRIQLACRLAIAMVEHANNIVRAVEETGFTYPDLYSVLMGHRWTTMRPRITLREFIDIVSESDGELRDLLLRQVQYMRTTFRRGLELDEHDTRDEVIVIPEPKESFEEMAYRVRAQQEALAARYVRIALEGGNGQAVLEAIQSSDWWEVDGELRDLASETGLAPRDVDTGRVADLIVRELTWPREVST